MKIQDLHYGDVLFHFWADEDSGMEALTRLEAYRHWQRLPHHDADAQLVAAQLYLQLGLHNEAGQRFETLLTGNIPQSVRNRAWFYLAKLWYQRGYLDRAEQALGRVEGALPAELEGERMDLAANVLMRGEHYEEAVTKLRNWQGPADWMPYVRLNLGIALARTGRLDEAVAVLGTVGTLKTNVEEYRALRDKANLALGFALLQAKRPAEAKTALERVRLKGPYSNRALLGDGWALSALGNDRAALNPWRELRRRNLLDPAVQEAYFAVPYALDRLHDRADASESYEEALKSFSEQSGVLDAEMRHAQSGELLDELLAAETPRPTAPVGDAGEAPGIGTIATSEPATPQRRGVDLDKPQPSGWYWQTHRLPDDPHSTYLYALLADHEYQEGLRNLRDMNFLSHDLDTWRERLGASEAMVDTRTRADATRLERADALLATDRPAQLRAERAQLGARLTEIETNGETDALGTASQREQWATVRRLERIVHDMPPGLEREAAQDKLRLVKGVLSWQFDAAFRNSDGGLQRQLRDIDRQLEEAQNRWTRLQSAHVSVSGSTGGFAARIAALSERISQLQMQVAQTAKQEREHLGAVAAQELQGQHERLDAYVAQARFALASAYDQDATTEPAPAAPAAPGSPATPEDKP